jgi:hypothetical protein
MACGATLHCGCLPAQCTLDELRWQLRDGGEVSMGMGAAACRTVVCNVEPRSVLVRRHVVHGVTVRCVLTVPISSCCIVGTGRMRDDQRGKQG